LENLATFGGSIRIHVYLKKLGTSIGMNVYLENLTTFGDSTRINV
jgi:hypothetical protein